MSGGLRQYLRPMSDFHGGTRAPQSQIRVTFGLEEQPAEKIRDRLTIMPGASADTVVGYPYIEPRHVAVQPKDVVFARVADIRQGGKTDTNCTVFSAFNGEPAEQGISQDEFNKRYVAVAVTQGGSDPDVQMGGDKSGIAGITQGATTITNNSEERFTYGEYAAVVPPSVDPVERDRFHRAMQAIGANGHIPGKYTGRLKKVSYKDMVGGVEETVAHLLENVGTLSIPRKAESLATGRPIDDGDTESAALNMKRFLSWVFFSGLVTASRSAAAGGLGGRVRAALTSGQWLELAEALGLIEIPNSTGGELPRDLQEFYALSLVSSLSSSDLYDSTMKIIENIVPATTITTSFFGTPTATSTPSDDLLKEAQIAFDFFWRSEAHLLERQTGQIFLQCIGYAEPGGPLDVNVRTA